MNLITYLTALSWALMYSSMVGNSLSFFIGLIFDISYWVPSWSFFLFID